MGTGRKEERNGIRRKEVGERERKREREREDEEGERERREEGKEGKALRDECPPVIGCTVDLTSGPVGSDLSLPILVSFKRHPLQCLSFLASLLPCA